MTRITLVTSPLLQSSAQLFILPVSTDGRILDPVIGRCKTLFEDNYQQYRRACIEGTLIVGTALLTKRRLEQAGLGVNSNTNRPVYIANFAIKDYATHAMRQQNLVHALDDLYPQLYQLVRYEGLRRIALLARPLTHQPFSVTQASSVSMGGSANKQAAIKQHDEPNTAKIMWETQTYPILKDKLACLPKARIDIHVPKDYVE